MGDYFEQGLSKHIEVLMLKEEKIYHINIVNSNRDASCVVYIIIVVYIYNAFIYVYNI